MMGLFGKAELHAHDQQALWKGSTSYISTQKEFQDACMDIWTKIDLVHAIHNDTQTRTKALIEISKSIEHVASSVLFKQPTGYRARESSLCETVALLCALRAAFEETFKDINVPLYITTLELFTKICESLIAPAHIKP